MDEEKMALALTQVQFIKKDIDLEQEDQVKAFQLLYEKNLETLYKLNEPEPLTEEEIEKNKKDMLELLKKWNF